VLFQIVGPENVILNLLNITKYDYVIILLYPTVRPELRHLPSERRTVEGGTLIAVCEASGIPEPTVQWRRAGFDEALIDGPQLVGNYFAYCAQSTVSDSVMTKGLMFFQSGLTSQTES